MVARRHASLNATPAPQRCGYGYADPGSVGAADRADPNFVADRDAAITRITEIKAAG